MKIQDMVWDLESRGYRQDKSCTRCYRLSRYVYTDSELSQISGIRDVILRGIDYQANGQRLSFSALVEHYLPDGTYLDCLYGFFPEEGPLDKDAQEIEAVIKNAIYPLPDIQ